MGTVVDAVMRRPLVSAVASAAVLIALAVPAFGMHTVVSGAEDLPRDVPVVQTYDRVTEAFPGEAAGAAVVVQADDVTSGPVATAIADLKRRAASDRVVNGPVTQETSVDGTVTSIMVPTVGKGSDDQATAAMERIRGELVPASFSDVSGAEVNVAGAAAESKDFNDQLQERMPLVFAFVLGLAFLLLLVTFRSLVVPIKAIVLNLLSVGASYGVWCSSSSTGWVDSAARFHLDGGVSDWMPFFLFAILFGLSMDYHVLILSRVVENADLGLSTRDAVERGITATAGTVIRARRSSWSPSSRCSAPCRRST